MKLPLQPDSNLFQWQLGCQDLYLGAVAGPRGRSVRAVWLGLQLPGLDDMEKNTNTKQDEKADRLPGHIGRCKGNSSPGRTYNI